MIRTLLFTSYTIQENRHLGLRNNWIEEVHSEEQYLELIEKFELNRETLETYVSGLPIKVSNISEGVMDIPNVAIHVRQILR